MLKKFFLYICAVTFLASCGGDDGPPPAPEGATLVAPARNSECTTGTSISQTQSQVTFQWQASSNTDSYTLSVVNLNTNTPQTIETNATSASLSIAKGTPFSWSVASSNAKSDQIAISETWLFYNAGSLTSYAPFPAQLVSPLSGATVFKDIANEVELKWKGTDVESDIESFEVFFSDQNPPTVAGTTGSNKMNLKVAVESNTVYYWKVITTDSEGNTSDSGVFDFKVH